MVDIKSFSQKDLYELIGIKYDATEQEIRKAYRKRALDCHPDKNPDNPKAAELFQELSKVLEILTDKSARSAYNKILNARKAASIRNQQLDSKRQKLKADLEKREQNSLGITKTCNYVSKTDEELLQAEIDRLRKEGSKLLDEEQELMRKQLFEERNREKTTFYDPTLHRIKIKWKISPNSQLNYTEESLKNYLKKYGDINAIVVSTKKNGSALVEFNTQEAGEMAISYEKGNLLNPIQLEWIGDVPKQNKNRTNITSTISDLDFESLVLRQMRQAEERKRLIEEISKNEPYT